MFSTYPHLNCVFFYTVYFIYGFNGISLKLSLYLPSIPASSTPQGCSEMAQSVHFPPFLLP